MKNRIMLIAVAITALLIVNTLNAQGRGMRNQNRNYDVNTVVTMQGEVTSVETQQGKGRSIGLHLMLKTDDGEISVHVGPVWYLEDVNLTLEKGDRIEVTGSKIDYEGSPALIAAKIVKAENTTELRNANGIPNWAGNKR